MKKWSAATLLSAGLALAAITGSATAASLSPAPYQMASEHEHQHKKGYVNQELLSLLKMDAKTLKQELQAGKSLADIAAAKGVQKQQVIDLLVKQATQRIDEKVKMGKLTPEQAKQKKAKLPEWIQKRVENKGGMGHGSRKGHHGSGKFMGELSKVMGVDKEELITQLKAGKTLAEIAQSKGMSKEELINKLLEKHKEHLTKMVDKKWEMNKK